MKNKYKRMAASVVVAGLALGSAAQAAVITTTLGDADFTDGQIVGGSTTFNAANGGDPAPFNVFNGSDLFGPNFSASWTFNYGAIVGPITSATIQIGLFEGESAATGNQVASFTVDGFALTALLNTVMEATPGASDQENYYTVTLPAAALALLADGSATFSLALQGPGLGVLGDTPFNGAGLDFSTLSISTNVVTPGVPEPATWSLLLLGAFGAFGARRFSRRG